MVGMEYRTAPRVEYKLTVALDESEQFTHQYGRGDARLVSAVTFRGASGVDGAGHKILKSGKPHSVGASIYLSVKDLPGWLQELHSEYVADLADLEALVSTAAADFEYRKVEVGG